MYIPEGEWQPLHAAAFLHFGLISCS